MPEVLTWGAIIAAGGSLVAVVKFWMDIGKAHQIAEDAKSQTTIVTAKLDLLTANVNEYKVTVAQTYATANSLSEVEKNLARSLEAATQGIYQRLDAMNSRLDNVITIAKDGH